MSDISKSTSIAELGAIVCEALKKSGIDVFLSGGAVVSIYTNNKYESYDLDFVSLEDRSKIKKIMESLGFLQNKSRLYHHPNTIYLVEFPGSAMQIGEENITTFENYKTDMGVLKMLTPTDCVKDRLAGYFYFKDPQCLDQAIWVSEAHPINLESIKKWAKKEGMSSKLEDFFKKLKSR
ncbi:MAG: hypothetical protein KA715_08865 [Xanthomonadaceae bacterium]|nr:hypothetical protein [Xanthomonadaceae bacterium]